MVLGNQNEIAEQAQKKFPHYGTYAQCQSKAFMIGLFTTISSAAAIGLGQEMVKKFIPMTIQMRMMAPVLGGSIVGYVVSRSRTKQCQDMWMALEDKHTAFNDISASQSEST